MPLHGIVAFWAEQSTREHVFSEPVLATAREMFSVAGRLVPVVWAPGYAVSDDGRVFTCRPCARNRSRPIREMGQTRHLYHYRLVRLQVGKKAMAVMTHRLVAEAFLPPPADGQNVVRHLNGDPADNRADNLAWGTQADNMADCVRHGRTLKGLKNPNAKLNPNKVTAARLLAGEGYSPAALATFLGVGASTIRRALTGEQWGHVDGN